MSNRDTTREAVSTALSEQHWFRRRKDSITLAATVVLMALQSSVIDYAAYPSWVSTIVTVIIGVAGVVVVAGTKAGITGSMVERIAAYVPENTHSYEPDPIRESLAAEAEPYGRHAAAG